MTKYQKWNLEVDVNMFDFVVILLFLVFSETRRKFIDFFDTG